MSEIGFKKKIFEYFVWTRSKASVVGKTTEPHRDVVEPAPAAGLGGQAPVDVPGHVVSDQEEEGQEEAEQSDVPGVVKPLQTYGLMRQVPKTFFRIRDWNNTKSRWSPPVYSKISFIVYV